MGLKIPNLIYMLWAGRLLPGRSAAYLKSWRRWPYGRLVDLPSALQSRCPLVIAKPRLTIVDFLGRQIPSSIQFVIVPTFCGYLSPFLTAATLSVMAIVRVRWSAAVRLPCLPKH